MELDLASSNYSGRLRLSMFVILVLPLMEIEKSSQPTGRHDKRGNNREGESREFDKGELSNLLRDLKEDILSSIMAQATNFNIKA